MDIMDILNETINPRDLAKKKKEAYQEFVLSILDKVTDYVGRGDIDKINDLCFHSPAGDDYGLDNDVLNFSPDPYAYVDIMGAMNIILYYDMVSKGDIKSDKAKSIYDLIYEYGYKKNY